VLARAINLQSWLYCSFCSFRNKNLRFSVGACVQHIGMRAQSTSERGSANRVRNALNARTQLSYSFFAAAGHSHKNPIFHHFGPGTAQKRLRGGYMNGLETLERAASASPRRNEQPWEVPFASGKTSRRVSRDRVAVPPRYFRPKSLRGPIVA
jgi:hypothetical protein